MKIKKIVSAFLLIIITVMYVSSSFATTSLEDEFLTGFKQFTHHYKILTYDGDTYENSNNKSSSGYDMNEFAFYVDGTYMEVYMKNYLEEEPIYKVWYTINNDKLELHINADFVQGIKSLKKADSTCAEESDASNRTVLLFTMQSFFNSSLYSLSKMYKFNYLAAIDHCYILTDKVADKTYTDSKKILTMYTDYTDLVEYYNITYTIDLNKIKDVDFTKEGYKYELVVEDETQAKFYDMSEKDFGDSTKNNTLKNNIVNNTSYNTTNNTTNKTTNNTTNNTVNNVVRNNTVNNTTRNNTVNNTTNKTNTSNNTTNKINNTNVSNNKVNNTSNDVANKILPAAGKGAKLIISVLIISILGIYCYTRYEKYNKLF